MEEIKLDEETRKAVKEALGFTDEDIDKLSLENKQIMSKMEDFGKYKIVAECIRSERCGAQVKVGQKIVFTSMGFLIPEECTSPLCIGALCTMMPYINCVYNFIGTGLDPTRILTPNYDCMDTNIDHGGIGKVTYKFHVEKIS